MKVKELSLKKWFDPQTKEDFEKDLYEGLREYGFIILKDHSVNTG